MQAVSVTFTEEFARRFFFNGSPMAGNRNDPNALLALSIIYQAKTDSLQAIRGIRRAVTNMRRYRNRDEQLYERHQKELKRHICERRSLIEYTNSVNFISLCIGLDLSIDQTTRMIREPVNLIKPGKPLRL